MIMMLDAFTLLTLFQGFGYKLQIFLLLPFGTFWDKVVIGSSGLQQFKMTFNYSNTGGLIILGSHLSKQINTLTLTR